MPSPAVPAPTAVRPLRSAVVYNPVRVDGLQKRRTAVDAALAAAGWPTPEWIETTPEDPGAGMARRAVDDGVELVFACGGDGTVRSVVEGVAGTSGLLAILPAGTGNLLATNLGVPEDPAACVQLVLEGGRRRIDVGEVDGQAFAVMAGMGFDAAMLDSADSRLKSALGPIAYVFSALKHLRGRSMRLHIRLDDQPPFTRRARSVVVGNVGMLQGGIQLMPGALPDDGWLDVVVVSPRGMTGWLPVVGAVLTRRNHATVEHFRCRTIEIHADKPMFAQLDGDPAGKAQSLKAWVDPLALIVRVPG